MSDSKTLLQPNDCALVLIDQQAGLAFGVGSIDRQVLLNNTIALTRTAKLFGLPIVASTSASKVYSGPLMAAIREVLPDIHPIERRNMNLREDDAARTVVVQTGKRTLIVSGLLTEACVSFPVLSALHEGFDVFVVGDACGGLTPVSHDLAFATHERRRRTYDIMDPGSSGISARLDASGNLRRSSIYRGNPRRRVRNRPRICSRHDPPFALGGVASLLADPLHPSILRCARAKGCDLP
ncbi:hypothetical protein ACVWYH_005767 [Bradyrhizobium sp. GM24.11]